MLQLFQDFDDIRPLRPENRDYIQRCLKRTILKKKAFLLKPGQVSRHIYYVEKGMLRCFRDGEKSEMTRYIMTEGRIIVSVSSFFAQDPSIEYIEALEDCVLHSISFDELEYAYNTWIEFNLHGRVIVTRYYQLSEAREHYRQVPHAMAFALMMQKEPHLLARVPYKYLASYLGMTPETFRNLRDSYLRGE